MAASEGKLDICQKIIEKVDNKNPPIKPSLVQVAFQDQQELSPLHFADNKGHFRICRLIMTYLEDRNPTNQWGSTSLCRCLQGWGIRDGSYGRVRPLRVKYIRLWIVQYVRPI